MTYSLYSTFSSRRTPAARTGWKLSIAISVAMLSFACDADDPDDPGDTNEQAADQGVLIDEEDVEGIQFPPGEGAPGGALAYRVSGLDDAHTEALRGEIGNLVYLPARDCSGAHPEEGTGSQLLTAVELSVEAGEVVHAEPNEIRDPEFERQDLELAPETGRDCIVQGVAQQLLEVPEGFEAEADELSFDVHAEIIFEP